MAIEPAETGVTRRPPDRLRRHVHRRPAGARRGDARAGGRRRPRRVELDPRLLGPDDHPGHPRRPRGGPAGGGGRRRTRRRDRGPDQGHRGHLAGHRVGNRSADGGALQRRSVLRAGVSRLRERSGPQTRIEGIGPEAIRCANCGADATPFTFANGYTIAFDELRTVGLTVPAGGGRGVRPRGAPLRRPARQLRPEPDPHLRSARHRRAGHPAAAVPGPDRHLPVDHHAGLAQRGRLRLVPDRRPARRTR